MRYVLGADPGGSGAIVLINADAGINTIKPTDVILIPTTKLGSVIDSTAIMTKLKSYASDIVMMVQEHVHALFGSGATATFSFGDANGALRVALEATSIMAGTNLPVHLVVPKTWQHVAWEGVEVVADSVIDSKTKKPKLLKSGLPRMKTDTKATSMNAAHAKFPGLSFLANSRCTREHDGLIDAALIAYYALVKYQR